MKTEELTKEDVKNEEFGYFSKTVAERIGIGKDTLRTWSIKLEAEGVKFERNNRDHRIYYEKDIRMFENMKELMDLGHPLIETAKTISQKYDEGLYDTAEIENHEEKTLSVFEMKNEVATQEKQMEIFKQNLIQEFQKSQQEQLDQFKDDLTTQMAEKMQDVFEKSVNDAVKMALAQERKKIAEEVTKELAASQEKEKKPFWKAWFK